MERLNHSQGPLRVQKSQGKTRFNGLGGSDGSDLLHFIRIARPEYFQYRLGEQFQEQPIYAAAQAQTQNDFMM